MRFIFISCFLLLSFNMWAQTGKITGKVLSSKTGEPLIGATVSIDSLKKSCGY